MLNYLQNSVLLVAKWGWSLNVYTKALSKQNSNVIAYCFNRFWHLFIFHKKRVYFSVLLQKVVFKSIHYCFLVNSRSIIFQSFLYSVYTHVLSVLFSGILVPKMEGSAVRRKWQRVGSCMGNGKMMDYYFILTNILKVIILVWVVSSKVKKGLRQLSH